jgi:hypothetical protein
VIRRLLLDPAPDAAGGGAPPAPAAPPPAATSPPATPPAAPPAPPPTVITLTLDQYKRIQEDQARLATIEEQQRKAVEAERQKAVDALAAKGQVEEALRKERDDHAKAVQQEKYRSAALEGQILGSHVSTAVTDGVAGVTFISPEAGAQARKLAADRLEAVRDPATGAVTVREKGTLRPAADAMKAWVGSADAKHFLAPTSRGGAGTTGTDQGAPATPPPTNLPLDEQLVAHLKGKAASAPKHYGLARRGPVKV